MDREKLIWNYIDETLSTEDKLKVDQLLDTDKEFESVYKDILFIHKGISSIPLVKPSASFSSNIIATIEKQYQVSSKYKNAFSGFGYFPLIVLGIIVFTMLAYFNLASGTRSSSSTFNDKFLAFQNHDLSYLQDGSLYIFYTIVAVLSMLLLELLVRKTKLVQVSL